ncbi:MAG: GTPase ObgE [Atribacterota bacterium]|nr:GTPase ObgE [Atribacterota bacterium]
MMFSDKVIIYANAGNGGNGSVSFRRERFVPRGGPDGGDGGKGGNIIIQADYHTRTLIQLYRSPHCNAEDGGNGRGQKKNGKDGQDLLLKVPVGTVVEDTEKNELLADLSKPGEQILVAKGGAGGKGNYRFRGSQRQAPMFAQRGEPGERVKLRLNLKLIADVGLVGFPNAGKSTLLSRVSAAKPKIADYPFTTIEPCLGVVQVDEENSFVIADIPGLIEGAHQGVGMGTRFLKHIERTKVLIHLIDGSLIVFHNNDKLFQNYLIIENELKQYADILQKKEKIVVINKYDLPEVKEKEEFIRKQFSKENVPVMFISAISGEGVDGLIYELQKLISIAEKKESRKIFTKKEELAHYRYEPDFVVTKEGDTFIVKGNTIVKMVNRYDLQNPQALEYFQKILKKTGVEKALKNKGIKDGDKVKIGDTDFYFYS